MKKHPTEQAHKVKLPHIQEIYNRITWDKRLNKQAFIIDFADRMSKTGVSEKPFIEWNTGAGEIPWHRIQYIRCGDTNVWDQPQRIDLFASNRLPAEAWPAAQASATTDDDSSFYPQQAYEFTANAWKPVVRDVGNSAPASLRIVTYNVRSDAHEKELIKTHLRIPAIITELQQAEADIIVLQEATVPFLHALMQECWVQQMYLSEGWEGKQLEPQGILILARYPFTVSAYAYSPQKTFLVGHWTFHQQHFHVAALHLTSNPIRQRRTDTGKTVAEHSGVSPEAPEQCRSSSKSARENTSRSVWASNLAKRVSWPAMAGTWHKRQPRR